MSDISMCRDYNCPSKNYCFRFTAQPSEFRQSYGGFSREEDADNCDMFWKNGKDSEKCKHVDGAGSTCTMTKCTYPNCIK